MLLFILNLGQEGKMGTKHTISVAYRKHKELLFRGLENKDIRQGFTKTCEETMNELKDEAFKLRQFKNGSDQDFPVIIRCLFSVKEVRKSCLNNTANTENCLLCIDTLTLFNIFFDKDKEKPLRLILTVEKIPYKAENPIS